MLLLDQIERTLDVSHETQSVTKCDTHPHDEHGDPQQESTQDTGGFHHTLRQGAQTTLDGA